MCEFAYRYKIASFVAAMVQTGGCNSQEDPQHLT
jgi:hypothetical protein